MRSVWTPWKINWRKLGWWLKKLTANTMRWLRIPIEHDTFNVHTNLHTRNETCRCFCMGWDHNRNSRCTIESKQGWNRCVKTARFEEVDCEILPVKNGFRGLEKRLVSVLDFYGTLTWFGHFQFVQLWVCFVCLYWWIKAKAACLSDFFLLLHVLFTAIFVLMCFIHLK